MTRLLLVTTSLLAVTLTSCSNYNSAIKRLKQKGARVLHLDEFLKSQGDLFGFGYIVLIDEDDPIKCREFYTKLANSFVAETAVPVSFKKLKLENNGRDFDAQLVFAAPELQNQIHIDVQRGHFLTAIEVTRQSQSLVLTTQVAEKVSEKDPIKAKFSYDGSEFSVVGEVQFPKEVVKYHLRELGFIEDIIFVPFTTPVGDDVVKDRAIDLLFVHSRLEVSDFEDIHEAIESLAEQEKIKIEVRSTIKELADLTDKEKRANPVALVDLSEIELSEEIWRDIGRIKDCERLFIKDAAISDENVDVIINLENLKTVVLDNTQISEENTARIRQALPSCRIMQ